MSIFLILVAIAVSAAGIKLSMLVMREKRKRLLIIGAATTASTNQLENIYTLVERTGTLDAVGYILARTNKCIMDTRCLIPIPTGLPAFPWAGKVIEVIVSKEIQFRFVEAATVEPTLLGYVYRPVQVPRHTTKVGAKARNAFAPEKYVASSPELNEALKELCSEYPTELLIYLLSIGLESFSFEPMDQARIGTSPAWVQNPEHQICDKCGKRMCLVLQLPGTAISKKSFHTGTIYLFGCTTHLEQIKMLEQFT